MPLEVILALALGLLVGLGAGASLALRLVARRRAAAGLSAGIARLWPDQLPSRSAADILAGRIRVVLAGTTYNLPVLPRGASRRWLEQLDERFAGLASDLQAAGDDTPRILATLVSQADTLYEALLSYDQSGVLPARELIDATATDTEILRALLEVWRAANPLAATLADRSEDERMPGIPFVPPTGSPRPTAGDPTISTPG